MIMNLTTEKIPSADSTGAPYVAGNFAPLKSEVTAFELEVIGRVPEELTGRFLRIGPNPIDELDRVRLGLRLRGGKAEWFRSRFVLDRDAAKVLSRKPIAGPGEGRRDGNVNTNLMNVGGKLCAVVEAGSIPVELDYELASVRRTDFDGTLEAGFTGHPKFDPSRASTTPWRMNRSSPFATSRSIATGAPRPRRGSTCRTFRSSTTWRLRSPSSSSPTSR
jgi:carotenoid cleavage dioxygenase-like enzyme